MITITIADAIYKLKPTAQFSYENEDYSTIKWDVLEGDAPAQEEINNAIEQIKADKAQALIDKAAAKAALLAQLGITEEQAKLLLS